MFIRRLIPVDGIRSHFLFLSLLFSYGCSSVKFASYHNWDADNNKELSRYDFISGFIEGQYFQKWANDKNDVYNRLYDQMFNLIDADEDDQITEEEFSAKNVIVTFGDSNVRLFHWMLTRIQFFNWKNLGITWKNKNCTSVG